MSGHLVVLYDGACPLCRGAVDRIRSWDPRGDLELLPFQDPSVESRFPELSPAALQSSLHVVEPGGKVLKGADAVARILDCLPGKGAWASFLRFPLIRPFARVGYAWVARRRIRRICDEHCGRP